MNTACALITGASHGIGKAIAYQLASEGFRLVLNCRTDVAALESYAKELTEEFSVPTLVVGGDIGDYDFVQKLFDTIANHPDFGSVDVLVNNAGISYVGLLTDMSIDEWQQIVNTNLTSVFACCKHAIPSMVHKKAGRIINISSVWGNVGASCEVAYSATKGGINSFTKALAKELAPSNIQVNAIACGVIDTRMNGCFSDEDKEALANEVPMGRFGTAEEVAKLAWQLCTAPEYLTGQIITLDGAWI